MYNCSDKSLQTLWLLVFPAEMDPTVVRRWWAGSECCAWQDQQRGKLAVWEAEGKILSTLKNSKDCVQLYNLNINFLKCLFLNTLFFADFDTNKQTKTNV